MKDHLTNASTTVSLSEDAKQQSAKSVLRELRELLTEAGDGIWKLVLVRQPGGRITWITGDAATKAEAEVSEKEDDEGW